MKWTRVLKSNYELKDIEFKDAYQAMQYAKDGKNYPEIIDLMIKKGLSREKAALAAQYGKKMFEDSYREKSKPSKKPWRN